MTDEQSYDYMLMLKNRSEAFAQAIDLLKNEKAQIDHLYATHEEQVISQMQRDGVIEDELFKITESESVDVSDVNALPDEYVRIKREPDKVKIRKNAPDNVNWYSIKKTTKLTLKS